MDQAITYRFIVTKPPLSWLVEDNSFSGDAKQATVGGTVFPHGDF